MSLTEIRIPTYRRPKLLKRALESVISQTDSNWICRVYDDSPDREAESVVAEFNELRFRYEPNNSRLGGAGNIDRAFSSDYLKDTTHACILEDDNWFEPDFIASNIQVLGKMGVHIMLRNQTVYHQKESSGEFVDRTTRGRWMEEKKYSPKELHSFLLVFEGIPNGGLFWSVESISNLVVGEAVPDSGLQEYCRTIQIKEPIYFAKEPKAIWCLMDSDLVLRSITDNRSFARGRQAVHKYVLDKYPEINIESLAILADKRSRLHELIEHIYFAGYEHKLPDVSFPKKWFLKRFIRSILVKDPLKGYFENLSN